MVFTYNKGQEESSGGSLNDGLKEIDEKFDTVIALYPDKNSDANMTLTYWKGRLKYYYILSNTSLDKLLEL